MHSVASLEQSSAEEGLMQEQGQAHCNTAHIKLQRVSNNITTHVKNRRDLCTLSPQAYESPALHNKKNRPEYFSVVEKRL